jgi:hypothetical protein
LAWLLIFSNLAWGLYSFSDKGGVNEEVTIYRLDGFGAKWSVKDYSIVVTPNEILRGHAELIYQGNPQEVGESNYYAIRICQLPTAYAYAKRRELVTIR